MHTGLPSVSAWVFRVLSVLRGRAGFPVKSRLLPPQSRHRAPLECCTAAHRTACERSRSAGRFSGDPFVRRVRACRSSRPRSGCRARRVRSWAPSACSSKCYNSPKNFSCMPKTMGKIKLFPTTEYSSKQPSDPVVALAPRTGIFLGPSKSGKTVALISLILEQHRGVFERIYIFSPSVNRRRLDTRQEVH